MTAPRRPEATIEDIIREMIEMVHPRRPDPMVPWVLTPEDQIFLKVNRIGFAQGSDGSAKNPSGS